MTAIAGRLDALNGRPKDYTSMDIRTPEYPQIFDFMIISLFVVDHTPICEAITAKWSETLNASQQATAPPS